MSLDSMVSHANIPCRLKVSENIRVHVRSRHSICHQPFIVTTFRHLYRRGEIYMSESLTSAWVRIPAWACGKVASDLGLGGGFRRVLRFPPLLTTD